MIQVSDNVNDPTLKAITKYRKHPSILTVKEKRENNSWFSFFMLH